MQAAFCTIIADGEVKEITTLDRIKKVIIEQFDSPGVGNPITEEMITLGSSIRDDLGGDSMDDVELVMGLEEEFDLEIPDHVALHLITVQDGVIIADLIMESDNTRLEEQPVRPFTASDRDNDGNYKGEVMICSDQNCYREVVITEGVPPPVVCPGCGRAWGEPVRIGRPKPLVAQEDKTE